MPLLIEPAVDADIERTVDLQFAAFGPSVWNQIMFPITTPGMKAKVSERNRRLLHDPIVAFMKVVDTDRNNEMVGYAKWSIYKHERPESEWAKQEKRDYGEGVNVEAFDFFINALGEKRRKIMAGKPHCLLDILVTSPEHQRRGAGAILLQWGMKVADEASLPCYLESSPEGYNLYHKNGFEDVDCIENDMTRWGHEGVYRYIIMVRPAKAD